jgi:hypothetical protein
MVSGECEGSTARSVVFLQQNNRGRRFSTPIGREIAIAIREAVKRSAWLSRYVRLSLTLPEVKAFARRNPTRGCAHIGNYELNNAGSE